MLLGTCHVIILGLSGMMCNMMCEVQLITLGA